MKSLLLASLILVPIFSPAVTDNPDGSVTFVHEEAVAFLQNIRQMESDQQTARVIFNRMQKRIDELEKRKCL